MNFISKELSLFSMSKTRNVFIPPAFMKLPTHCNRRSVVFDGVKCIDTVICHYFCQSWCDEYIKFSKKKRIGRAKMVSRPELIQICQELEIEHKGVRLKELENIVREEIDKRFKGKKVSADGFSDTLKKFLTKEFDYVIKDKTGKKLE